MRCRSTKNLILFTLLFAFNLPSSADSAAQTKRTPSSARATNFRIEKTDVLGGTLYVTVGGQERKIFNDAYEAWLVSDGHDVVFSSRDGAGGFENEGQSLRIYNVRTHSIRKVLSEYFFVTALKEAKLSTGASALLVKLGDGGLGGSYFAVVDPLRGEVFFRPLTRVTAIEGDLVTLAYYRAEDFDAINDEHEWKPGPSDTVIAPTKVPPYKTEQHDLKKLLRNRVIYNRRPNPDDYKLPPSREIKIYLWDVNSPNSDIVLVSVTRKIGGYNVLKLTLDWLFGTTLSKEENDRGLILPTFGMHLEGVTLKDGVALVKFSQPAGAANYGSQGAIVFAQAIEKTARQFPTVKKVEICAVGETLIDSQLEKPFPKCAK